MLLWNGKDEEEEKDNLDSFLNKNINYNYLANKKITNFFMK